MRDKGRLKVECGYAIDRQALESGAYDKAAIAVFRITNEGRQTITVEKISISLVGQRGYLSWDHKNIPRSLQPSEFVVEHFDYDFEKTLPCEVMVVDTYGKKWRAPKDEVINLRSRPRHQNSDLAESISEETQLE